MTNRDVRKFLYDQKKKDEIYPINPDGQSLAILNMIDEIQRIGYSITCFTDIEWGHMIKDDKLAVIILKYYDQMESCFTKETLLSKINAKKHPEIIDLAFNEYKLFTPFEKRYMLGLQQVLCRGIITSEYIDFLFSLIDTPDDYAAGIIIRRRLMKISKDKMRKLSFFYSEGLLLSDILNELFVYQDSESIKKLVYYSTISEEQLHSIIINSSYNLCSSFYESYKKTTTASNIRIIAQQLLKKIKKTKKTGDG